MYSKFIRTAVDEDVNKPYENIIENN